jgi:protein gp37
MDPGWAEALRGECARAGIPFYMKQDSGPRPDRQGHIPLDLWAIKEFPAANPFDTIL